MPERKPKRGTRPTPSSASAGDGQGGGSSVIPEKSGIQSPTSVIPEKSGIQSPSSVIPEKSGIQPPSSSSPRSRPSSLLDTRVIYCGDNLEQLAKLPDKCVDLIYIDPPFNSNRNYEVFSSAQHEPRPSGSGFLPTFEDRHASTQAYIDSMRPRCVQLAPFALDRPVTMT